MSLDRSPCDAASGGLHALAAHLSGVAPTRLAELTRIALHDHEPPRVPGGWSDLSWTGAPLQLLVSCRGTLRVRVIADPAHREGDPVIRLERSLAAMERLLVETGAVALRDACWRMLRDTLPRGDVLLRRYPTGMLRLAAALPGPGIAVYAGACQDADLAWQHAGSFVRGVLPDPAPAQAVLATLTGCARLFGVAIEGTAPRDARLKLYWRLAHDGGARRPPEIPLLGSADILAFLADVMGARAFPGDALTFSAGFALATGALHDVKVDVCNRSAALSPRDAAHLIERHARGGAAGAAALIASLAGQPGDVALGCAGLGLDVAGGRRLNLYLFPPST